MHRGITSVGGLIMAMLVSVPSDALEKVAFVTSASGPADFSAWPEATEKLEGGAAADSICVNLATTAGLTGPGDFKAYISTNSDDAWCRVQGLSGTKAGKCGLETLPSSAGPWVRTDGMPWGATLPLLVDGTFAVYSPLRFDENGSAVALEADVWTATWGDATSTGSACASWTSTANAMVRLGRTDMSSYGWSTQKSGDCSNSAAHLYCLQSGAGDALQFPNEIGALAFITQDRGPGNLSLWAKADPGTTGIEAGDSICNNIAEERGYPHVGLYKAWLSDANVDARDRFVNNGPWRRNDGLPIASDLDDITDGDIFVPLNKLPEGNWTFNTFVWTGTLPDGTANFTHCNSWTDGTNQDAGATGITHSVSHWTDNSSSFACSETHYLYCLADVDVQLVFEDGFETDEPD